MVEGFTPVCDGEPVFMVERITPFSASGALGGSSLAHSFADIPFIDTHHALNAVVRFLSMHMVEEITPERRSELLLWKKIPPDLPADV